MRYIIILSNANEIILNYLGLPYEKSGNAIIFEGDPKDLERIAKAILDLGYAHNKPYALQLAKSFFLNPVGNPN